MTTKCCGWAAPSATAPLEYWEFERRALHDDDISIKIDYCGICHTDIHVVRNEWGRETFYPLVPGHEIVGHVTQIGKSVTKFKVGDLVGVGCMVDSCLKCSECQSGEEQCCDEGFTNTYNKKSRDGTEVTKGGYADHVVVKEHFVLRIPTNLHPAAAAPLLCAGITTYSPLRRWGVKEGTRVGVVGLGGLGHMAVKLAKAMGGNVTVFTTSQGKKDSALALGADKVVLSTDAAQMSAMARQLDVIIDTVGAEHDLSPFFITLAPRGVHVLVGIPSKPHPQFHPALVISGSKCLAGSGIGGIRETQEMLDLCAEKNITADIEMIDIADVNVAFERMLKNDVKYRFVIDLSTLKKP
eukprot:gene10175-7127_t